jgi:cation transport regulator ChaC
MEFLIFKIKGQICAILGDTQQMGADRMNFIFGYGSLICPQSRAVTAPTLTSVAEPATMNNIERTWSARVMRGPSCGSGSANRKHIKGWTPMGVRIRKGVKCNGVLFCVDEQELHRFDVREAGYRRHRIDVSHVIPHVETDDLIDAQMPFWPENERYEEFRKLALKNVRCADCRLVFE